MTSLAPSATDRRGSGFSRELLRRTLPCVVFGMPVKSRALTRRCAPPPPAGGRVARTAGLSPRRERGWTTRQSGRPFPGPMAHHGHVPAPVEALVHFLTGLRPSPAPAH